MSNFFQKLFHRKPQNSWLRDVFNQLEHEYTVLNNLLTLLPPSIKHTYVLFTSSDEFTLEQYWLWVNEEFAKIKRARDHFWYTSYFSETAIMALVEQTHIVEQQVFAAVYKHFHDQETHILESDKIYFRKVMQDATTSMSMFKYDRLRSNDPVNFYKFESCILKAVFILKIYELVPVRKTFGKRMPDKQAVVQIEIQPLSSYVFFMQSYHFAIIQIRQIRHIIFQSKNYFPERFVQNLHKNLMIADEKFYHFQSRVEKDASHAECQNSLVEFQKYIVLLKDRLLQILIYVYNRRQLDQIIWQFDKVKRLIKDESQIHKFFSMMEKIDQLLNKLANLFGMDAPLFIDVLSNQISFSKHIFSNLAKLFHEIKKFPINGSRVCVEFILEPSVIHLSLDTKKGIAGLLENLNHLFKTSEIRDVTVSLTECYQQQMKEFVRRFFWLPKMLHEVPQQKKLFALRGKFYDSISSRYVKRAMRPFEQDEQLLTEAYEALQIGQPNREKISKPRISEDPNRFFHSISQQPTQVTIPCEYKNDCFSP